MYQEDVLVPFARLVARAVAQSLNEERASRFRAKVLNEHEGVPIVLIVDNEKPSSQWDAYKLTKSTFGEKTISGIVDTIIEDQNRDKPELAVRAAQFAQVVEPDRSWNPSWSHEDGKLVPLNDAARAVVLRERPTSGVMNFGQALDALRQNKLVARAGWNGKGMYLFYAYGGDNGYPHGQPTGSAPHISMKTPEDLPIEPCICLRTAQGTIQPGWVASQPDMRADDWMIVDATADLPDATKIRDTVNVHIVPSDAPGMKTLHRIDNLLREAIKHVDDPNHRALIVAANNDFYERRFAVRATTLFEAIGGKKIGSTHRSPEWRFPSGASVEFMTWNSVDARGDRNWIGEHNWIGLDEPERFSDEAKNILQMGSQANGNLHFEFFDDTKPSHPSS